MNFLVGEKSQHKSAVTAPRLLVCHKISSVKIFFIARVRCGAAFSYALHPSRSLRFCCESMLLSPLPFLASPLRSKSFLLGRNSSTTNAVTIPSKTPQLLSIREEVWVAFGRSSDTFPKCDHKLNGGNSGTGFALCEDKKRLMENTTHNGKGGKHTATNNCSTQQLFTPLGAADKATLFLRLFIGALLFTEAITKSQNYMLLEGEYPTILGLNGADVVSLVGVLEVVAGVMITVGLLTRLTAGVMAVAMLGAAFLFFPHQTFSQGELKVVYAGIYITLLISGGGRYSFDSILFSLRKGRHK